MAAGNAKGKAGSLARKRTASIAACVVVGVLLALPIPFVNTAIGYMPLIAYLFVLGLCYAYVRILRDRLVLGQTGIGSGCMRGEQVSFSLTIENRSFLPAVSLDALFFISDLFGEERESVRRRVSLPPHASKTFDFALSFDHIGTYQVGIRQVELSDPFGIFTHVRDDCELFDVFVRPRIYDIASLRLSSEAVQESKSSITAVLDDGMDYYGVREYRWGDPIKSIHWKLSSRNLNKDYYTRLYETSCDPGAVIIMDFESADFDNLGLMSAYDAVVESALSVECWCSAQGFQTDVMFVDGKGKNVLREGPLAGSRDELVGALPRICAGTGAKMLSLLETEASSAYGKNNVVVISSRISSELVSALLDVRANRKKPILVAVIPPEASDKQVEEVHKTLAPLSVQDVDYFYVRSAADLVAGGR